MIRPLVILGSGGYGKTVKDVAEQLGYGPIVVLDDANPDQPLSKYKSCLELPCVEFVVAFGNNEFRLSWISRLEESGATLATLIHPTAYVSPKATIHPGTVVLPHATINTGTEVKRGCIVNIGSLVDHDCVLEAGVHLAPGAIVKGENRIPACFKIESGVVVERGSYKL